MPKLPIDSDTDVASGSPAGVLLRAHLQADDHRGVEAAAAALKLPRVIEGDEAILALAALAIAETFALIKPALRVRVRAAIREALDGVADAVLADAAPNTRLAWCTAAAEWCEREGLDHEFARLEPLAAAADGAASAFWRVHWRAAAAWHHEAFGRVRDVARLLSDAQAIAEADGAASLVALVGLARARLALARDSASRGLAEAQRVVAAHPEAEAPLWHAHAADVACRVALARGDYHAALHAARRCDSLAAAARASDAYRMTFRVHEAYALVGLGAFDDAVTLARNLASLRQPTHLRERLELLAALFEQGAALAKGRAPADAVLTRVLRRLRELNWPGVLPLLPNFTSRLWAHALERGIEVDWVVASIRSRDLHPPAACWPASWPWAVQVRVLGNFELRVAGADLALTRGKAAKRPLELMTRLAAFGGFEGLPVEPLAAAMWPGDGREGRRKVFEITLTRLRRLLGANDALLLHNERLRLNPRRVWLDRGALEHLLAEIEVPGTSPAARKAHWTTVLALWRGPLLADAGTASPDGLVAAREALRNRLAGSLLADESLPGHRSRCLRAIAADPPLAARLGLS